MKLNTIRFGCALSTFWGLTVLLMGVANLIWPTYGVAFLQLIASIYPGYHFGQGGFLGVIFGTLYAIVDGWIGGVIFAWLYNLFVGKSTQN